MCSANHCTWNIFLKFFYVKAVVIILRVSFFKYIPSRKLTPVSFFLKNNKNNFSSAGGSFLCNEKWSVVIILQLGGGVIRLYNGLYSVVGSLKVTLTLITADLFLINFMFINSLCVNAVFFLMWFFIWSYLNVCFISSYLTVVMF